MIDKCKYCEYEMSLTDLKHAMDDGFWGCHCMHYSFNLNLSTLEVETLKFGNFYLCFINAYNTASIVTVTDEGQKVIKSMDMNELTHEQAVQWVNKLKTYTTFQ